MMITTNNAWVKTSSMNRKFAYQSLWQRATKKLWQWEEQWALLVENHSRHSRRHSRHTHFIDHSRESERSSIPWATWWTFLETSLHRSDRVKTAGKMFVRQSNQIWQPPMKVTDLEKLWKGSINGNNEIVQGLAFQLYACLPWKIKIKLLCEGPLPWNVWSSLCTIQGKVDRGKACQL